MTSLYSLRSASDPGQFTITKFDHDFNPQETYALSRGECDCPAGPKPTCRHRKMLPLFLEKGHLNDGWFLDWDTRMWRKPLATSAELSAGPTGNGLVADQAMMGRADDLPDLHNAGQPSAGQPPELGLGSAPASPPAVAAPEGVEQERPAPPSAPSAPRQIQIRRL
jgi:hypothetical protein